MPQEKGTKIALLNANEWRLADRLAESVEFVELAILPEFQDCFVDELEFSPVKRYQDDRF